MEILAGLFVMLVTTLGAVAPSANIPQVLGVSTIAEANTDIYSSPSAAESRTKKASERLENAKAKREQVKRNFQAKWEEAQEKLVARREELQSKLSKIKDTRKRNIVQNVADGLNNKNERWVSHWNNVLDRLTEILAKLEDRTATAKQEGKDVAAVESAIVAAKTAIADAQSAVNTQSAKVYEINITSEEMLRSDVQKAIDQFKADLRTVHSSISKARQAVQTTLRILGSSYPGESEQ